MSIKAFLAGGVPVDWTLDHAEEETEIPTDWEDFVAKCLPAIIQTSVKLNKDSTAVPLTVHVDWEETDLRKLQAILMRWIAVAGQNLARTEKGQKRTKALSEVDFKVAKQVKVPGQGSQKTGVKVMNDFETLSPEEKSDFLKRVNAWATDTGVKVKGTEQAENDDES